jgi:hypothetical protein
MPAVTATVPGVEIARAGEWNASTGRWLCSVEDIADAVRASHDPAFAAPILKVGHVDPRFDGEPALGVLTNLRAAEDGTVLVADISGVPEWLASIMASAYPRRSVEASLGVVTDDSKTYRMVVTGLALLGVAMPAVESLADVADLYGVLSEVTASTGWTAASTVAATMGVLMPEKMLAGLRPAAVRFDGPNPVEVNGARVRPVRGSAPMEEIWDAFQVWARGDGGLGPEVYIEELGTDYLLAYSWMVEGVVWRVPWSEAGGTFTFGPAVKGDMVFTPDSGVSAASADHGLPSARGRGPEGSREDHPPVDVTPKMRELLGLPDDASPEAVEAAMQALHDRAKAPANAGPEDEQTDDDSGDDAPDGDTAGGDAVPTAVAAAFAQRDKVIASLSKQLADRNAREAADKRSQVIKAALDDGKITPAERPAWEADYDSAPDVTAKILARMAPGTAMPVQAAGHAGHGSDSDDDAFYKSLFGEAVKSGG